MPEETQTKRKRGAWPKPETRRNCRMDYIQGKGSISELSRKYSVKIGTIKRWAIVESWSQLRADFDRLLLDELKEQLPADTSNLPPQTVRLNTLEKRLRRLEELMAETADASAWRAYAVAHTQLFGSWCILANIGRPATRKTGRRSTASAGPVAPTFFPEPGAIAQSEPQALVSNADFESPVDDNGPQAPD